MIEIEIKYNLNTEQEKKLLSGAEFISEELHDDIYYDSFDYSLTTKDIWLRSRNGSFILKLPVVTQNQFLKNQNNTPKDEIEDEQKIREYLKLLNTGVLLQDLKAFGYLPIYKYKNIRKKYAKDGFIIDLDHADFGDFTYDVCEIELIVADNNEVDNSVKKIRDFASKHDLTVGQVDGKLIRYMKHINPKHFQMLQNNKKSK